MLSGKQIKQYDRDGIVFPIPVLSDDEVSFFRAELESLANNCETKSRKRFDSLHLFFDWARKLAGHEAVLNAVEDLLGPEILVFGTLVFNKPARDSSYVSWHQDSFYSGLHLTPSTSAWIALTNSDSVNGCMRVIPGSHKLGALDHVNVPDSNLLNRRGEKISVTVDNSRAIDATLKAGEMSLHQSTIIHGSNPNTSDQPRIGFIVRYVTNQFPNRDWPLVRVRGNANCDHLNLADGEPSINALTALAKWRAFTTARAT